MELHSTIILTMISPIADVGATGGKATQEAFDGLEQVDERIVACADILDRLIHSDGR